MRLRVWLAFALLALAWGSSYLWIRVGVRHLSPLSLVALRLTIAAAGISIIVAARGHSVRTTRTVFWRIALLATINTSIPFLLITWGEVAVPSGLASVLNSTVPIFSVLLAAVVLKDEPLTVWKAGGVALGFGGVILLFSRDLSQAAVHWSTVGSQAAIVLASLCYAVGAVMVRRTLRGTPSMTIATYTIWVAAAETLVASLIFSPPALSSMQLETVVAVLWLGLLGSAVAYVLAFFILAHWGAGRYTLIAYALPVVGLTLGAVFLRETLDWRMLAGSALVMIGIVFASLVRQPRLAEAPAVRPPVSAGGLD